MTRFVTSSHAIAAAAVFTASAGVAWFTYPSTERAPLAPAVVAVAPARAAVEPASPVVADVAVLPPREAAAVPSTAPAGKGSVKFPDGSVRAALNGVTEELEIPWPAAHPWSPIVEQLSHGGTDWFRHADGTFTTTVVRTETVSGRTMQIPLCFTPSPTSGSPALRH